MCKFFLNFYIKLKCLISNTITKLDFRTHLQIIEMQNNLKMQLYYYCLFNVTQCKEVGSMCSICKYYSKNTASVLLYFSHKL